MIRLIVSIGIGVKSRPCLSVAAIFIGASMPLMRALCASARVAASAAKAEISRIVSRVSGPITTARSDTDVIVTEFGVAELRGQTLKERARRMMAIAHPDFREALERDAHDLLHRGT